MTGATDEILAATVRLESGKTGEANESANLEISSLIVLPAANGHIHRLPGSNVKHDHVAPA